MASLARTDLRFAVLIDADNVSEKYIKIILDEVSNNGIATYKRIYGDWTSTRLAGWKNCLLGNSITPMQQYSYTTGKNATDSALIIDAMDILHSGNVDGFAIVSSDSDFTRLAARLRESGMYVIGMGEQKTPEPFVVACNQFKYLDLLHTSRLAEDANDASDAHEKKSADAMDEKKAEAVVPAKIGPLRLRVREICEAVNAILEQLSDDSGWLRIAQLGSELNKRYPDFDVRNYGHSKLSHFLKTLGKNYEFNTIRDKSGNLHICMRIKSS